MLHVLCQNGAMVNRTENDERPFSPLQCAIIAGRKDMIDTLLSYGAKVTAPIENTSLKTALHFAIGIGAQEMVPTLLQAGKGIDWMEYQTSYGKAPLHWAASFGDYPSLQLLLELPSQSEAAPTSFGEWPIHLAAMSGCVQCLEAFCAQGNIDQPGGEDLEQTPLYCAASLGALNNIIFLLGRGAAVDGISSRDTPLMAASREGQTESARTLIKHGANIEAGRDSGECTALELAASIGNDSLCHALLQAGGDPLVNTPKKVECALHEAIVALQQGPIDIFLSWLTHPARAGRRIKVKDALRLLHASVSVGDSSTWTRLMNFYTSSGIINRKVKRRHLRLAFSEAVDSGQPQMLMLIVEAIKKLSPHKLEFVLNGTKSGHRISPLAFALNTGNLTTLKTLVHLGASVNTPHPCGQTAIHKAAIQGFAEAVRFLLDSGADPTRLDEFGLSAIDYGRPFPAVMKIFESHGHLAQQSESEYPSPSTIFSSLRKQRNESSVGHDPAIMHLLRLLPVDIVGPYMAAFVHISCDPTGHPFDAGHQMRYCCPICPTVDVCRDCYYENNEEGPRLVPPEELGHLHNMLEFISIMASRVALALRRAPGFRSGGGRFLHRMVKTTWLGDWARIYLGYYENICRIFGWKAGAAVGKPYVMQFMELLIEAAADGDSGQDGRLEAPFDPWFETSEQIRAILADHGGTFSSKESRKTAGDVPVCLGHNDHSLIPIEPVPPFGNQREKYTDKRGFPTEALLNIWEGKLGPERMNLPRGGKPARGADIQEGGRVGGGEILISPESLSEIRGELLEAWNEETQRRHDTQPTHTATGEEAAQVEEDDVFVVYEAAWYIAQVTCGGPDLKRYSKLEELVQDEDENEDENEDGDENEVVCT